MIVSRKKIGRPGPECRHGYFKHWSPSMAWILGFIMADGCLTGGRLQFGLSKKDIHILEFIKSELKFSGKIYLKIFNRYGIKSEGCQISIRSQELYDSLIDHGITPRKTGKEQLKYIPAEFKGDYLCGLFDGDGSARFRIDKNKEVTCDISICTSSPSFAHQIQDSLAQGLGNVHHYKKISIWRTSQEKSIRQIYTHMYRFGRFCLERKRVIIEQMLAYYDRPQIIGERRPKVTPTIREEVIRVRRETKAFQQEIAKQFGLSQMTVSRILAAA